MGSKMTWQTIINSTNHYKTQVPCPVGFDSTYSTPKTSVDFGKPEYWVVFWYNNQNIRKYGHFIVLIFTRYWCDHFECPRWLYVCEHNVWHELWSAWYYQGDIQTVRTVSRRSKSWQIDMVEIVKSKTKKPWNPCFSTISRVERVTRVSGEFGV